MAANAQTVAAEIAAEIKERESRDGRKKGPSITENNDGESHLALDGLGETDATPVLGPATEANDFVDFAKKARDRILALRANARYWEGTLSYAQRCHLNGALVILQEMLQDKDDAKLPLTMARYLGITVPHWPRR